MKTIFENNMDMEQPDMFNIDPFASENVPRERIETVKWKYNTTVTTSVDDLADIHIAPDLRYMIRDKYNKLYYIWFNFELFKEMDGSISVEFAAVNIWKDSSTGEWKYDSTIGYDNQDTLKVNTYNPDWINMFMSDNFGFKLNSKVLIPPDMIEDITKRVKQIVENYENNI